MIGRIYALTCDKVDGAYIGSTTLSLKKRMAKHKYGSSSYINKWFWDFGSDSVKITLLKEYEVVDKKHLYALEQLWINKLRPINRIAAFKPILNNSMHLKNVSYQTHKHIYDAKRNRERVECECGGHYMAYRKKSHMMARHHSIFLKDQNNIVG